MKYLLFILIAVCSFNSSAAQNIVVNSDLETVNICDEHHAKCSPAGWFYFKPDPAGYLLSENNAKTISASGTHHFTMLAAGLQDSSRDYWQTKLLCPLVPGKKYRIICKVSAPWGNPNLSDLGFWFSDRFIEATKDTLLQPTNFVGILDAKIKSIQNGWFQINKEFTANSPSDILIIGNFSKEKNSNILSKRHQEIQSTALLLDDIQIFCDPSSACTINQNIKDSLYALKRRHSIITPEIINKEQQESFVKSDTVIQQNNSLVDTISINSIQFALDDSRITDKSIHKKLKILIQKKQWIEKLEVIGYTDDLGTEEHNYELSKNRAASAIKLLVEQIGFDPGIISVRGEGISRRFEKKDLNRRVDIIIFWKH